MDSSQYVNRLRARDFDVTYSGWSQSLRPGNEQAEYWGSKAADREGSKNYAGIKDSGIDALIRQVIFAKDRPELVASVHALDRVLLAHHYIIPSYAASKTSVAYWSKLRHPATLPYYGIGFPDTWWAATETQ